MGHFRLWRKSKFAHSMASGLCGSCKIPTKVFRLCFCHHLGNARNCLSLSKSLQSRFPYKQGFYSKGKDSNGLKARDSTILRRFPKWRNSQDRTDWAKCFHALKSSKFTSKPRHRRPRLWRSCNRAIKDAKKEAPSGWVKLNNLDDFSSLSRLSSRGSLWEMEKLSWNKGT